MTQTWGYLTTKGEVIDFIESEFSDTDEKMKITITPVSSKKEVKSYGVGSGGLSSIQESIGYRVTITREEGEK